MKRNRKLIIKYIKLVDLDEMGEPLEDKPGLDEIFIDKNLAMVNISIKLMDSAQNPYVKRL